MSHRRYSQYGFTVIELLTVIVVSGVLLGSLVLFFNSTYQGYLNLHQNALRTNQVSSALQRVSRVLRGTNSIIDASSNSITAYAYFTPRDTTLSKIRYYYDTPTKSLIAGVTPATGSPPSYTYNPSDERKLTILENVLTTQPIFSYLDASWNSASFTAETYKDIKGIKITLENATVNTGSAAKASIKMDTSVSLRNRKTNL